MIKSIFFDSFWLDEAIQFCLDRPKFFFGGNLMLFWQSWEFSDEIQLYFDRTENAFIKFCLVLLEPTDSLIKSNCFFWEMKVFTVSFSFDPPSKFIFGAPFCSARSKQQKNYSQFRLCSEFVISLLICWPRFRISKLLLLYQQHCFFF